MMDDDTADFAYEASSQSVEYEIIERATLVLDSLVSCPEIAEDVLECALASARLWIRKIKHPLH